MEFVTPRIDTESTALDWFYGEQFMQLHHYTMFHRVTLPMPSYLNKQTPLSRSEV